MGLRFHDLLHLLLLLQVYLAATDLIGSFVAIQRFIVLLHLSMAVAHPGIRECLIGVLLDGFAELQFRLTEIAQSEVSCTFIVVVYWAVGLYLYGCLMAFYCLFVFFQGVQCGAQIAIIGCYLRVDLNCLADKLYLLLRIPQLPIGLPHQIIKLALLRVFEPFAAVFYQFAPIMHMQQRVGGQQVFLAALFHLLSHYKYVLVFFVYSQQVYLF